MKPKNEVNFLLESGTEKCPCVRKRCERYGNCEKCIDYHTTKSKTYPQPYCRREKKTGVFVKKSKKV